MRDEGRGERATGNAGHVGEGLYALPGPRAVPSSRSDLDIARVEHPYDDPTLAHTPVAFSSWHRALGLLLRCDTNDERIQQAALDVFGPAIAPDPGAEPDALIRLFVHDVDEEPGFLPRQPLVRSFDGLFTVAASRASVIAGDVRSGRVSGFVSRTVADNADFLRATFVPSSLLQIAQPRSLVAVHSACLHRDGRTLLLRGDSGAGKSTLAYAALRRGYALVAEDVVFLRSRSGQAEGRIDPEDVEVHGMPWRMHLLPDAALLFPELAGERVAERPDGRLKIGLTIEERFPGQTRPVAPLGPLVFVERSGNGAPRLLSLDRADALRRLRETAIHYEEQQDAEHSIWDAFLSLPAYRIETGLNPDENAALLDLIVRPVSR